MTLINSIIHYWLDCIRNEDVLGNDISLNARSRAVLYPFTADPFIFTQKSETVVTDLKIIELFTKAAIENNDVFFGYPLLLYLDENQRHSVAPLFVMRIEHKRENGGMQLSSGDTLPSLGIQALSKIGLRAEEISDVEKEIEEVFKGGVVDPVDIVKKCLTLVSNEAPFTINETIDPTKLTNDQRIPKNAALGVYNKSVLFPGESTAFNMGLIKDLEALKSRMDIGGTALGIVAGNAAENQTIANPKNKAPLLPFPLNEYQISALTHVLRNKVSVITGPPGTGKSQFILNLLINIFLNGQTALFVSHTNEAVNIVNAKLDSQFTNLLFRTGSKELRQQLTKRFNDLALDFQNKRTANKPSLSVLQALRNEIINNKRLYLQIDNLQKALNDVMELRKIKKSIIAALKEWFFSWRLKRLPSKTEIEKRTGELMKKYFEVCTDYVQGTFTSLLFKRWHDSQKAKLFVSKIGNLRSNEPIDDHSFDGVLNALPIWSSTLKSISRSFPLKAGIFDYVIFDEASQVDLPSAAPALYRAKQAIVVGDPMQLSHIAGINKELDVALAKSHGLTDHKDIYPDRIRYYDVSLFKSAELCSISPTILLAKHYRSHDQIADLCNQIFYGGRLTISSPEPSDKLPGGLTAGVQWTHVQGETVHPVGGSRLNTREAEEVSYVFFEILSKIKGTNLSIGVVTPYSAQQKKIETLIANKLDASTIERHGVKIMTAHKFQGSEKDIMIFSLVLSSNGEGNSDRWYQNHPQILNVALSRARRILHIVGDRDYCAARSGVLNKLITTHETLKQREDLEKNFFSGKFDSPYELALYQRLQSIDFQKHGYRLVPKYHARRYTLDFALVGERKIDIECDGFGNHNMVDGLPVLEDLERDDFLRNLGWTVLRFPNHQIAHRPDECVSKILKAVGIT